VKFLRLLSGWLSPHELHGAPGHEYFRTMRERWERKHHAEPRKPGPHIQKMSTGGAWLKARRQRHRKRHNRLHILHAMHAPASRNSLISRPGKQEARLLMAPKAGALPDCATPRNATPRS